MLCGLPAWWGRRRAPAERFLLAWVVPAWLVFEAVPTKLPHYTLPLYPAVFLLAARLWAASPGVAGRWRRWVAPGLTLGAAALLGLGASALPVAAHDAPWLGLPALLAAALAGWTAVQAGRPVLALAAMPLLTAALLGWELPRSAELWLAPRIEHTLLAARLADRPTVAVGFHEPSLMVEAGTATLMAATGADGAQAIAAGQAASAVVADRDEASFQGAASRLGLHLRVLGRLRGFNYSRGRDTTVTLYAPEP